MASSATLNNNFNHLDDRISTVNTSILTLQTNISSLNSTLNSQINNAIQTLQQSVQRIGQPILSLDGVLNENEIWLEGAIVSRTTYNKVFEVYGTTYGAGDGTNTFQLPNVKGRVLWGSDGFGYLEAAIPNIVGSWSSVVGDGQGVASGAITTSYIREGAGNTGWTKSYKFYLDASRSSSVYKNNCTTVQPPAIKVRFKTRYQ